MKFDQILLMTLLVSVSLDATKPTPRKDKYSHTQQSGQGGAQQQTSEGGAVYQGGGALQMDYQAYIDQGYTQGERGAWVKDGIVYRIGEGGALYEAVG